MIGFGGTVKVSIIPVSLSVDRFVVLMLAPLCASSPVDSLSIAYANQCIALMLIERMLNIPQCEPVVASHNTMW